MACEPFAGSPLAMEGFAVFLSRKAGVEEEHNPIERPVPHGSAHRLENGVADKAVAADLLACIVKRYQRPVSKIDNSTVQPGQVLDAPSARTVPSTSTTSRDGNTDSDLRKHLVEGVVDKIVEIHDLAREVRSLKQPSENMSPRACDK